MIMAVIRHDLEMMKTMISTTTTTIKTIVAVILLAELVCHHPNLVTVNVNQLLFDQQDINYSED